MLLFLLFPIYNTSDSVPLWYQSRYLALDRHRDIINNNSSTNKLSIKSFEDLSETLDSLTKTQNLLFNKIQNFRK